MNSYTVNKAKNTYFIPSITTTDNNEFVLKLNNIPESIKKDVSLGYSPEYGPNYAIECQKALDYFIYVNHNKGSSQDIINFNTKDYKFVEKKSFSKER